MFFILSPTSILCEFTYLQQARNLLNVIQRSVELSLQLMYPTDSFGNICGRGEFSAKPLLLFFDLTKCASLTALAGCPTPQVTVSTLYLRLHNIYTVSTQYLHSIYTISTLYLHNIHTPQACVAECLQHSYTIYTISTQHLFNIYTKSKSTPRRSAWRSVRSTATVPGWRPRWMLRQDSVDIHGALLTLLSPCLTSLNIAQFSGELHLDNTDPGVRFLSVGWWTASTRWQRWVMMMIVSSEY